VTEFRVRWLKERGRSDGLPRRGKLKVYEMMDFRIAKQRREEMPRKAEKVRLAKALREARKRGGSRRAALTWELKGYAGRLAKLLKTSRTPRSDRGVLVNVDAVRPTPCSAVERECLEELEER
jgi:hypothetical protein